MTSRVLLLGSGIGYSASPAIQNAAFRAAGLAIRYGLCDVGAADLARAVRLLRDESVIGANVTTPHKVTVLELVDEVDPSAARIEAANVIVRRRERLVAHNTDLAAIAAELGELRPAARGRAVVLGAGGAARTVAAALDDSDWGEVRLVGREHWTELPVLLAAADLVVNATPIGTASEESPAPSAWLRPGLAVLDLTYRPSPTRLVREARAMGAPARAGAGVLLRQAALSFTLWTDRDAPISVMRDALRGELGPGADV
jgi:shikimate dehydrogenase